MALKDHKIELLAAKHIAVLIKYVALKKAEEERLAAIRAHEEMVAERVRETIGTTWGEW